MSADETSQDSNAVPLPNLAGREVPLRTLRIHSLALTSWQEIPLPLPLIIHPQLLESLGLLVLEKMLFENNSNILYTIHRNIETGNSFKWHSD